MSEIYTNPQTQAHLRAVLAKLRSLDENSYATLDDIEGINTDTGTASEDLTGSQLVYVDSAGDVHLADASSESTGYVSGAATADATSGSVAAFKTVGIISRTGWGLTPGQSYFLSGVSPGEIVSVPDVASSGEVVIMVGRALSATELFLNPQQRIIL